MDETRRSFLLKLARGAAYAAPVMATMATPGHLLGQSGVSTKKGMGGKKGAAFTAPAAPTGLGTAAPWQVDPPGSSGPSGG